MHRTGSFSLVNRTFEQDNKKFPKLRGSVGSDLHGLEQDRAIKTDPGEARRRRTIKLHRNRGQSWGFTLQTYGIRNKRTREVEIMSYVDYVEVDGSAWMAGMKRGDIILSVNGESVELCTHRELVRKIQKCTWELRLVVLFEDCCQKVELHERYLKLKRLLSQKVKELRELEAEEKKISQGIPLSRCDSLRQSTYSSTSSDWDIYSEITSPTLFDTVPVNRFAFRENCNQSFSDVSTESSHNSDSLSSVSSFMPKCEEDSSSLKSGCIAGDENKSSRPKFSFTGDGNFLSSTLEEDIFSSSEILDKDDGIIIQPQLREHEDESRFIEDDDRSSSFIQDSNSRFLFDELEDNSRFDCDELEGNSKIVCDELENNSEFSCVRLENNTHMANKEEEDTHISVQNSCQQESDGFSHVEIEGKQRCMMCGLDHMDKKEEQNEEGCRHTFPAPSDSVALSCDIQPEMSQCFNVCLPPSTITPESSHIINTSFLYEEESSLVSVSELKPGNGLPHRLAEPPYTNGTAHTASSFNHQDCTILRQSEAEESTQVGQDSESITGLSCGVTAGCQTGASNSCSTAVKEGTTSSGFVGTELGFSLEAPLCDACKHVAVNCSCSNAKCQEISNSNTKYAKISNSKCQEISNSKCQEISNSNAKDQENSNSSTKCQDSPNSNIKNQDSPISTKYADSRSQDTCSKCQDSDSTCLGSAISCGKYVESACSEHNCQTSQARGDPSSASSKPVLSELFSHSSVAMSRTQEQATDQVCVSSKKRLINGVLVNDRSYSTRL